MMRLSPSLVCLALAATLAACNFPNRINALAPTSTAARSLETVSTALPENARATPTASTPSPSPGFTLAALTLTPALTSTLPETQLPIASPGLQPGLARLANRYYDP